MQRRLRQLTAQHCVIFAVRLIGPIEPSSKPISFVSGVFDDTVFRDNRRKAEISYSFRV